MHDIFSKKIVLILIGFYCFQTLDAQVGMRDNRNYLEFQDKSFYFGMAFGTNFSKFNVYHSSDFIGNDSIRTAEGIPKGGFNIHMITNMKMGEYFDFRFLPGFAFSYRSLIFNSTDTRSIESVFFDLPFSVRFKSEPYKDKRAFFMAGMKYSYDVASNSKTRKAESLIKISPHDFQWEVGVGMQFFYPYFILSPEIKYSRGFNNVLIYNNSLNESKVIQNINSQVFTISFNFEG